MIGAILFLIVTIPLARLVDWLIAREQQADAAWRQPSGDDGAEPPTLARAHRRTGGRPGMNDAGPILRLEGVCKRFGKLEVLRGVDLEVERGEVVCVLGPSGSGKSTLLRCINLLEPPEGGRILLEGHEITGAGATEGVDYVRQRVGMVFQQFNLFPHKCALDNVAPRAGEGARPRRQGGGREGAGAARPGRARRQGRRVSRTASPAASSSGSRSPARWRWTRT